MDMIIAATVHPNSKKPRLERDAAGRVHVYVSPPAVEGRANEAAIKMLAEHYGAAKSRVRLLRGGKSKQKTFEIET